MKLKKMFLKAKESATLTLVDTPLEMLEVVAGIGGEILKAELGYRGWAAMKINGVNTLIVTPENEHLA